MFGINKNGTKHKIGIIMPAFFPASRTTYDPTTSGLSATVVQEAIDEVAVRDYDTVEVIGKTNGKKIKRVMFNYANSVAAGSSQILGTISDLDYLLSMRGGCVSSGNYYPAPFADDASAKVLRLAIAGGTNVTFYNNLTAPFYDIYCIVEYVSTESI